jgi:hypothetical protein
VELETLKRRLAEESISQSIEEGAAGTPEPLLLDDVNVYVSLLT